MALLSIFASVTGWGICHMVQTYRYEKGRGRFVDQLHQARMLALTDRTDLKLTVWKEKKGVFFQVSSDDPLAFFWSQPQKIANIVHFSYNGEETRSRTLPIYSTGRVGNEPFELKFVKRDRKGFAVKRKNAHYFDLKEV